MLELYHAHISTCSQKVRLCLAEKELNWKSNVMTFAKNDHLSDEYLKINPNGVVPSLTDNKQPIIDSSVICEYLEEEYPESGSQLLPDNPLGKAKVRAWLRYIEEVPTVAIRFSSFNLLFKGHFTKGTEEERAAHRERLPLRKDFYKKFDTDGFNQDEIKASQDRLRQVLNRMEVALENNDWVCGDQFTLADICLTPTIVRMEDLKLSFLWEDLPHFQLWYKQIQARPSFNIAFYDGARSTIGDSDILSR